MFCVVGNCFTTLPLLASRSSIFAPFFISCNGGVRSYSLSIFPPIFRPTTVVSEVKFPLFYIPFLLPVFSVLNTYAHTSFHFEINTHLAKTRNNINLNGFDTYHDECLQFTYNLFLELPTFIPLHALRPSWCINFTIQMGREQKNKPCLHHEKIIISLNCNPQPSSHHHCS